MKLIIGGYAQGKLAYVLNKYPLEQLQVYEGELPKQVENNPIVIINHLHLWVKKCLKNGLQPEELFFAWEKEYSNCIVICDEVGNGIVPIEAFEREYRERTGRLLIEIAKQAEEVERVICGIGQKLK